MMKGDIGALGLSLTGFADGHLAAGNLGRRRSQSHVKCIRLATLLAVDITA